MVQLASLRHSRRAVFAVIGLAVVLATAGIAVAAPSTLTFTPQKADQITNIDVLRQQIKNFYGTPDAAGGSGETAGWTLALNPDSNYARETESVASQAEQWLKARAHKSAKPAIVFDVDDTTLTTWNYELFSNWDYNPGTNAVFVGLTGTCPACTFTGNLFPATPGMLDLAKAAQKLGYAIFWITGRGDSQHQATIANLVSDTAAGFGDITSVTYSGATLPEIDAGYPAPTAIDIGHGAAYNGGSTFADGLFTKPDKKDYPAYLNTAEFCASAIAANASCATIPYKAGTRAYIESQGYDIVADLGDQYSDLNGGYADRTFKMPNPNYYLP
jgi:HAD superfamily, subfamily IIIB (Acid phosphatase)